MQIDIHYYGVYDAMARLAGLMPEMAGTIATAPTATYLDKKLAIGFLVFHFCAICIICGSFSVIFFAPLVLNWVLSHHRLILFR